MVSRAMTGSVLLSSLSTFALLANLALSATDMPTTCYVLNGTHKPIAGFRCNNQTSGHSSCCGIGGICYSNGVCQQSNGALQDYLRVGCTDPTWKDPACLDQCRTFATGSAAGIRFCNGAITATTQYCCDNGTAGIGSFACCKTPSDIFAIAPAATFVAQIPLTYTSTKTSSSSSSTSPTRRPASTTTTSPAPKKTAASSSSNSHAAAIGAGVGVPVGILALAAIGFIFWRRRRNAEKHQVLISSQNRSEGDQYSDNRTSPAMLEAPDSIPMVGGKKGYFAGREYEPARQEMPSPNVVHEMPANGR